MEKEIKSITMAKEQEVARLRAEFEVRFGRELQLRDSQIELKESRMRELDQQVELITHSITELRLQNGCYLEANSKLQQQVEQLSH